MASLNEYLNLERAMENLENFSAGGSDSLEVDLASQERWEMGKCNRKKAKNKIQLKATR
jgi:hypothetical protein